MSHSQENATITLSATAKLPIFSNITFFWLTYQPIVLLYHLSRASGLWVRPLPLFLSVTYGPIKINFTKIKLPDWLNYSGSLSRSHEKSLGLHQKPDAVLGCSLHALWKTEVRWENQVIVVWHYQTQWSHSVRPGGYDYFSMTRNLSWSMNAIRDLANRLSITYLVGLKL